MVACPVNVPSAPEAPGTTIDGQRRRTTMTPPMETIYAGVDTHTDTHTLALLDWRGRPLATRTFPTDAAGYEALAGMLPDPSRVVVGVEGTNSYGAALARRLAAAG
ncbi:IS110 family transposase, partial [Bifidobacterium lemurum]